MTNIELIKTVARQPLAWFAVVLVSAVGVLFGKLTDSGDARVEECQEVTEEYRKENKDLRDMLNNYTSTILLQKGEIQNRNYVIDSLRHKQND